MSYSPESVGQYITKLERELQQARSKIAEWEGRGIELDARIGHLQQELDVVGYVQKVDALRRANAELIEQTKALADSVGQRGDALCAVSEFEDIGEHYKELAKEIRALRPTRTARCDECAPEWNCWRGSGACHKGWTILMGTTRK